MLPFVLAGCGGAGAGQQAAAPEEVDAVQLPSEAPGPSGSASAQAESAAPGGTEQADTGEAFPSFSTEDIYGTAYDSESLFAAADLTMINFWGTYCGPCIREMPDLGNLSRSMPEGAQLVGVVVDVSDESTLEAARTIAEDTQADYPHLLLDEGLLSYARTVSGVPTTVFVDSGGNLVGEPILGVKPEDTYREEIESRMAQSA